MCVLPIFGDFFFDIVTNIFNIIKSSDANKGFIF